MCTVTFSPRKRGYALAMNRDEKLSRTAGISPKETQRNGRRVLAPSEPAGGTWFAANDAGVTFALINWYSIQARAGGTPVSRGEVVRIVESSSSVAAAIKQLEELPLQLINPFRLIGIFPETKEISEWRWDLNKLRRKTHRWQIQQWISSGFDEPKAQQIRSATFRQALKQKSVGTLAWLRRLHRSHKPKAGPFSICMHRVDAATVSYTEANVSSRTASMRYIGDAPCQCTLVTLPRKVLHLI